MVPTLSMIGQGLYDLAVFDFSTGAPGYHAFELSLERHQAGDTPFNFDQIVFGQPVRLGT